MKIIIKVLKRLFWYVCWFLPIKKNKIVFQTFYGRGYGDNPKYIAQQLLMLGKDIDFVWTVKNRNGNNLPKEFRAVIYGSFKYIYEMSTAHIWVDSNRKAFFIKKKNQHYMQTWHSSLGLKLAESKIIDNLDAGYIRMAMRDAAHCDVMLSSCTSLTNIYREEFWYPEGEILQYGIPRNDRLINFTCNDQKKIRDRLKINQETKLLMYAPTFRRDHSLTAYNMDYSRCKQALEDRFGGEWKILLRLHPNVDMLSSSIEFDPSYIINVTDYPDMQELCLISDAMITDYSSVIFDYILLNRPCFLYASDLAEYRKNKDCRFDVSELPFDLCENNNSLEEAIGAFDEDKYLKTISDFKEYHGFCETGKAAEFAANWIVERLV